MYRWIAVLVLIGCGGGTGGPGGAGGAGGGSAVGNGGSCCLNGSFFDCQTKAGFDKCTGFDAGACHAACSGPDFNCHMNCDTQAAKATHDSSACTRVASRDGECNSCVGSRGAACTYSTQCTSGNCNDGHCYARTNGNPCTYSTQCDSNNCTNNCCNGNAKGDACTYSTQCTNGNCSNGKCQ